MECVQEFGPFQIGDGGDGIVQPGIPGAQQFLHVLEHPVDLAVYVSHVHDLALRIDAGRARHVEHGLAVAGDGHPSREGRAVGGGFVHGWGVHPFDFYGRIRHERVEVHCAATRPGEGGALYAGAGGDAPDAVLFEEGRAHGIEGVVIPLQVRKVDPGADHIAKRGAFLLKACVGAFEHLFGLADKVQVVVRCAVAREVQHVDVPLPLVFHHLARRQPGEAFHGPHRDGLRPGGDNGVGLEFTLPAGMAGGLVQKGDRRSIFRRLLHLAVNALLDRCPLLKLQIYIAKKDLFGDQAFGGHPVGFERPEQGFVDGLGLNLYVSLVSQGTHAEEVFGQAFRFHPGYLNVVFLPAAAQHFYCICHCTPFLLLRLHALLAVAIPLAIVTFLTRLRKVTKRRTPSGAGGLIFRELPWMRTPDACPASLSGVSGRGRWTEPARKILIPVRNTCCCYLGWWLLVVRSL